jgi:hypothetical protein
MSATTQPHHHYVRGERATYSRYRPKRSTINNMVPCTILSVHPKTLQISFTDSWGIPVVKYVSRTLVTPIEPLQLDPDFQ